ncbi:MAG: hypothetical protein WC516_08965 [Patescibacteria group bacterium]
MLCGRFKSECICLDLDLDDSYYVPVDEEIEHWNSLTAEQKISFGASPEMVRACSVSFPQVYLPAGWMVWMCCNSPGCIYIGPKSIYDWQNIGGASPPYELPWNVALGYLNSSTEEDSWNLQVMNKETE